MAHHEPPHQDLHCLQIQLFSSLVIKELRLIVITTYLNVTKENRIIKRHGIHVMVIHNDVTIYFHYYLKYTSLFGNTVELQWLEP